MIIKTDISSFDEFEAWSGGKDTLNSLSSDQKEQLFAMLEDAYPDGMTDSELNDFLWFEDSTIRDWLNLDEDFNTAGSEDWARNIIQKHLESEPHISYDDERDFEDEFMDNEFVDGDIDDSDDLIDLFDTYVFNIWEEDMREAAIREFPDIDTDYLQEWLDDNFTESDIQPWEDFKCNVEDSLDELKPEPEEE